MKKPTPNPPEADAVADADSTSPYTTINSKKKNSTKLPNVRSITT